MQRHCFPDRQEDGRGGAHTIHFQRLQSTQRCMTYWAISDLNAAELAEFERDLSYETSSGMARERFATEALSSTH